MQPRSEGNQRCLSFDLRVKPDALVMQYHDFLGNVVHHFDIAGKHGELNIKSQSVVEIVPTPELQAKNCGTWEQLDAAVESGNYWEMLLPAIRPAHTPTGTTSA